MTSKSSSSTSTSTTTSSAAPHAPSVVYTEDDASLLAVVLDCNPYTWGLRLSTHEQQEQQLSFTKALNDLQIFLNAFMALNPDNSLVVVGAGIKTSEILCQEPSISQDAGVPDSPGWGVASVGQRLRQSTYTYISTLTTSTPDGAPATPRLTYAFAGALSLALCYIHRKLLKEPHLKPRILVLQASPDSSAQYVPVMNGIFSAQSKGVVIDACVLGDSHSTFLQQACMLTQGVYLKPPLQPAFLQYLLTVFLADPYCRQIIALPEQPQVDMRASCFCHKQSTDLGYVCSVCLSIFCEFSPICSTCGAKFALPAVVPSGMDEEELESQRLAQAAAK